MPGKFGQRSVRGSFMASELKTRIYPASSYVPGGLSDRGNTELAIGIPPRRLSGYVYRSRHTKIDELIEHIENKNATLDEQRSQLDLLMQLNRRHAEKRAHDSLIEGRIR